MTMLCADGRHAVKVETYLFGQFRIQLTDTQQPDPHDQAHGAIVRQMCTYSPERAAITLLDLTGSVEPLALAESWARPWNCEYPGGRIRLDNTPETRPEVR